jgi:hypothetical protein
VAFAPAVSFAPAVALAAVSFAPAVALAAVALPAVAFAAAVSFVTLGRSSLKIAAPPAAMNWS